MAYHVVFRPRAQADIAAAVASLARSDPRAAARWRTGLFQTVQKLEHSLALYALADEAPDLGLELRELPYGRRGGTYRILFRIVGQTVSVYRVRHAAQDRLKPGDV
jgi:plasmid stabilization system protein ParE